jgi:Domain of unknown function (DUF1818)
VDLTIGADYRLGWKGDASQYCALVGTEDWAIELSRSEFLAFRRLALELAGIMGSMPLMDQESLACELDCAELWMEVEGWPKDYGLRFILHQGRCFEGEWKSAIGLIQALESWVDQG